MSVFSYIFTASWKWIFASNAETVGFGNKFVLDGNIRRHNEHKNSPRLTPGCQTSRMPVSLILTETVCLTFLQTFFCLFFNRSTWDCAKSASVLV